MRTLIITLEYPPQIGGIASYTYNLAAHLSAADTVVWAPQLPSDQIFDAKNLWKVYRGKVYFSFFWPRWLKLYWQISKIVRQENIGQIYVHHVLPVGYVAKMIKFFYKIPFTIFFHGTDLELGLKFKKKKLENICKTADRIVVNSQFLLDKLLNHLQNLDKNKIQIINPCPADSFFLSTPAEEIQKLKAELALEGKKVILTVARLDEGKGFPHFVHLFPEILKKVPNAVWLIVGDGPKKKMILDQIQKGNLQGAVRYLGIIPYTNLPKFYKMADLFVLLTHKDENREEGWGTACLEAAASGLPIVAGRAGGVEEAVENSITGIVVDVYQTQEIVNTITTLLLQPAQAKQMGMAGFTRAQNEYTWSKQITKLN